MNAKDNECRWCRATILVWIALHTLAPDLKATRCCRATALLAAIHIHILDSGHSHSSPAPHSARGDSPLVNNQSNNQDMFLTRLDELNRY